MLRHAPPWLILCGLLSGCSDSGPTRAEVSGTVKVNGQPVAEGAINFFPVDGIITTWLCPSDADGALHNTQAWACFPWATTTPSFAD